MRLVGSGIRTRARLDRSKSKGSIVIVTETPENPCAVQLRLQQEKEETRCYKKKEKKEVKKETSLSQVIPRRKYTLHSLGGFASIECTISF